MADRDQLERLKDGVESWNKWREDSEVKPDLSEAALGGANLSGANLKWANLRRSNLTRARLAAANLRGANLSKADLYKADLDRANLSGANLKWANLFAANLVEANLNRAGLSAAILTGANLNGADLVGADLSEAMIYETIFGNTNLKDVKGLDTCSHDGPSVIDYRTLAKSGPLPLRFLRGCGLPEQFIAYLPSLLFDEHNQPIQFYSCFISYSTRDQAFADRLYADLQNKGVRCWFAPHDIQGGEKLVEQIDRAIQAHDRLLLLLSEASMSSEWVKTEIAKARKREIREKRRMLFPLRLVDFETLRQWECFDADTGKDSAREIREYFIPDFSDWKNHDSYQEALSRLIKDLHPK